jgi:transposase
MRSYNDETKQFMIDGFMFSLPSIGSENCITNYLIEKSEEQDGAKYNDYSYNFIFFLGDKRSMSFSEIENLIHIFNFDMEESDMKKVRKIVRMFQPIQKYSLKRDGKVIDINSKIDLEKIWK